MDRIWSALCGLICAAVLSVPAALAEDGAAVFKAEIKQGMNLQNSGAIIEMQPDGQAALLFGDTQQAQSLMFFWLTKEQCEGKKLTVTIQAKAENLSKGFVFGLQAQKGGENIWPAGTSGDGTFDWKPFRFEVDFAALGVPMGAVRVGLQTTTGKLWVKSLVVENAAR